MRRRLTYANVASTLALVFAMSGGALAAKHYLINSTKQINPKVLQQLRGARGLRGYTGEMGPQGATGPEGRRGETGGRGERGTNGFSALSELPSAKSESGEWSLEGTAGEGEHERIFTSITFSIPLEAPIPAEDVELTPAGVPSKHCSGRGTASPGWLCIYFVSPSKVNVYPETLHVEDPEVPTEAGAGTGTFGAALSWEAAAPGPVHMLGTYTVSAP